jgi:hypothetical protein
VVWGFRSTFGSGILRIARKSTSRPWLAPSRSAGQDVGPHIRPGRTSFTVEGTGLEGEGAGHEKRNLFLLLCCWWWSYGKSVFPDRVRVNVFHMGRANSNSNHGLVMFFDFLFPDFDEANSGKPSCTVRIEFAWRTNLSHQKCAPGRYRNLLLTSSHCPFTNSAIFFAASNTSSALSHAAKTKRSGLRITNFFPPTSLCIRCGS